MRSKFEVVSRAGAADSLRPAIQAGGATGVNTAIAGIPRAGWLDIVVSTIPANGLTSECRARAVLIVCHELPQTDAA